jgi:hypothetical protein
MKPFRLAVGIAAVLGCAWSAQGALVAHYQMNAPTPLAESVPGADPDRPDMTDPGGVNSPTFLPTGGVAGSGAYDFDGTDDYLGFAGGGYTFFAPGNPPADFTVSFWVKTTDTGAFPEGPIPVGYAGSPQVPVLGDVTESVGFALGVDGGVAAWRHYTSGWERKDGTIPIADGDGHFVTFVYDNAGFLDIYIDGEADLIDIPVDNGAGYPFLARSVGRSYRQGATLQKYGDAIIDDIRVYNTALTQTELREELGLPIPEPASVALLASGAALILRRRNHP